MADRKGGETNLNLLQGTLDLLILRSLAGGPLHGYDVVAHIRAATAGEVRVVDAALYSSLHRMETRGWLSSAWRVSTKGRRAKFYQLTPGGRRQLASAERKWLRFSGAVARLFARG
jgi:transcriptional regulator